MSLLENLYQTKVGRALARKAGLAEPPRLRRGRVLPAGPVVLVEVGDGRGLARQSLDALGVGVTDAVLDHPESRTVGADGKQRPPAYPGRIGALVVDATGVTGIAQLEQIRAALRPAVRALEPSGRVILLATGEQFVDGWEAKAVAHGLDGLNRTVGKELRAGATANLVYVAPDVTPSDLASTLSFLLEGRSAYVSGQVWNVGHADAPALTARPFEGRLVAVTGSARGIGAAITRTLARDGATVIAIDVPQAGDALAAVANEIGGSALQLDVTASDAGERIAAHVVSRHGPQARLHAIVHCAGILRDRMLANLDEQLWASVLEVNLASQLRMNDALLRGDLPGGLASDGVIVGIASTSGIAGNRGQGNYATSKAGVIGLVRAMAADLDGVRVNAVAPGFIETDMTASIPFVNREIFRRTNSMQQGGQPVDVAELIGYLASPASAGVDGQIVRVCGQNLVGQ